MKSARKILLVVAVPIALAGAGIAWSSREAPYPDVVSIKSAPHYQDAALLAEAWRLPVAAAYAEDGYEYQRNPSFCGPATAANLLQSQGAEITQNEVLAGTQVRPFLGLLPGGLTLDQEAEVLRVRTSGNVTVIRDLDLTAFRAHMARANDPAERYVINFHRGPLFGAGHGHFSPVLGYLAAEDLVFVGDVNDDFQPFLVSTARLFEAMDTVDSSTGLKRGLLLVETSIASADSPS
jgi:hypothetical protein